jgi:hypothetical protein
MEHKGVQRGTKRYKGAQRGTKRHKGAQRGTKGHKRSVLRPRCIGFGRARTQIGFDILHTTKTDDGPK